MPNEKALLEIINLTYECIGKVPTREDFSASVEDKILKSFHSLDEALNRSNVYAEDKFKQELLDKIKNYYNETGKIPNQKKLKNPGVSVYIRVFGSWKNVIKRCGINGGALADNSREKLIATLKGFYSVNGRAPFTREVNNPSAKAYRRVFGSWENALKAAGLPIDYSVIKSVVGVNYEDKDALILKVQNMYKESGRIPLARELENPKAGVYRRLFGSWDNFLNEAGLSKKNLNVTIGEKEKDAVVVDADVDEKREDDNVFKTCFDNEGLDAFSITTMDEELSNSSVVCKPEDTCEPKVVNKREMINAIVNCLDKHGTSFKKSNLPFPLNVYESEFGSWDIAYEEAVIEYLANYVM